MNKAVADWLEANKKVIRLQSDLMGNDTNAVYPSYVQYQTADAMEVSAVISTVHRWMALLHTDRPNGRSVTLVAPKEVTGNEMVAVKAARWLGINLTIERE